MTSQSIKQQIDFTNKDVFEIGCGPGTFTLEYLQQANSILAIEPDPSGIETLKESWPSDSPTSVDFRVDNILTMDFPADAYDVVIFSRSL